LARQDRRKHFNAALDLVVDYPEDARDEDLGRIAGTQLSTPSGARMPLQSLITGGRV